MQRELGRIRSEPGSHARTTNTADSSTFLRRKTAPRLRFELGMALPSTLVDDANGTTIRSGLAPLVGLAGTWMMSPRLQSVIGIRGSVASVIADAGSSDWNAGRTSQMTVRAGLEQHFDSGLGVLVGGSGMWLSGPDDVTPFRDDAGLHWGGEAGVSWRVRPARQLSLFASIEAFMLGGKTADDPIARAAWVSRLVLGVRRGA